MLELLGHLGHSDLRQVVVAYVRDMVTASADLEWMNYWDSAHMLHYFGFYDEARWFVDQARAQDDPEIRDEMREIEEFVFGAPEGGESSFARAGGWGSGFFGDGERPAAARPV